MTIMYCPNCKKNVFTNREEFNIGLAIVLAIFTGGIGLLIYIAIYFDKNPNRCAHCNAICQSKLIEQSVNSNALAVNQNFQNNQVQELLINNKETSSYCFNCGVKLDERDGRKYCPFCGTKIE